VGAGVGMGYALLLLAILILVPTFPLFLVSHARGERCSLEAVGTVGMVGIQ
jgi:hypothetical protein